jgi:PAS domain S-box-containing protein
MIDEGRRQGGPIVGERFAGTLERRRAQRLVELQRDIALALGSAADLETALEELLEATAQIETVECGGVYLVDDCTGELALIAHHGLSQPFVRSARRYGPESPQAALVGAGRPVYRRVVEYTGTNRQLLEKEGLLAIAVIPIQYDGRSIGAFNLGSRSYDQFPDDSRHALEAIAAQIGALIVRLKAQAELRASQSNFQSLFDALDDLLFVLDRDGRILHVNPAVERRLGYSRQELLGMSAVDVHPPEDRERAATIIAEMLDGKGNVCPVPLKTRAGSLIQVETKVTRGEWGGQPVLFGISRDITETKETENRIRKLNEELEIRVAERTAQIQENERKYRDLTDLLPQTVFEADMDGRLRYANQAAYKTFGYEEADLARGVQVLDTVAADYREMAKHNLVRVLKGERLGGNEYMLLRKNGSTFPGVIFSSPVAQGGQIVGVRGIIVDLSERKQAESALRREKEFAESLIEAAPTIVLVLDTTGRIIRCNPYLERVTGYRAEEMLGEDWFTMFLPESDRDNLRRLFNAMVSGLDATTRTNSIVTRDGRKRRIEWRNRTLKTDLGDTIGVLAIGHDISELQEAQQKALRSERLAAIGQMVTGLAHESGNALQRSQACLEMLAIKVEDRPEALDLVGRIQDAQDRLHKLYNEVRQYAGPIVLKRESVRLRDIVQRAWRHLEPSRLGRITRLYGECLQAEDICLVDPDAVEQVFQNIFDNSLAACPDPVEIVVTRSDGMIHGQPAVEVAVQDNGPGLDSEQRSKIFEPFYTTETRGTGLGMAISKRIVEAHGGEIRVGRDCARGAEIVITLPKESVDDATEDRHCRRRTGHARVL